MKWTMEDLMEILEPALHHAAELAKEAPAPPSPPAEVPPPIVRKLDDIERRLEKVDRWVEERRQALRERARQGERVALARGVVR